MAKPLLIKPILTALKKNPDINRLLNVANLSNINVVNIVRAKYDKKIFSTVAKTLDIDNKTLRMITDTINHTPARKASIKGKNYVNEIMRHTGMKRSIRQYVSELRHSTIPDNMLLDDENKGIPNVVNASLKELDDLIYEKSDKKYRLPEFLMRSTQIFDNDVIEDIIALIYNDKYYTEKDVFTVYSLIGKTPTSRGHGMYPDKYMNWIIDMLVRGHSVQTLDLMQID